MQDPAALVTVASTAIAGLSLTSAVALKGWNDWLKLKREQMNERRPERSSPSPVARIEVADLKERVRRLEAIASGVDLN